MPQKMMFKYGIDKLTIPKIIDISKGKIEGILTSQAIKLVKESREKVEKIANGSKAVYGINTGFGPLCDVQISSSETNILQKNLNTSRHIKLCRLLEYNSKSYRDIHLGLLL